MLTGHTENPYQRAVHAYGVLQYWYQCTTNQGMHAVYAPCKVNLDAC